MTVEGPTRAFELTFDAAATIANQGHALKCIDGALVDHLAGTGSSFRSCGTLVRPSIFEM